MTRSVFALLLTMLAAGLALDPAGSLGPATPAERDPRVLALRAEQTAVRDNPAAVKELENRVQRVYLEYQPPLPHDGGGIVSLQGDWQLPQLYGPDVVIDTGTVLAVGADYEMTGEMYVAYSLERDSTVRVVKSTDHGNTWHPLTYFTTVPKWPVRRLHVVVGSGDSAFVYIAIHHPSNNGDVTCARFDRNGANIRGFWISHDTATVTNFTFCRDYVYPYYLHCIAGNDDHGPALDDYHHRSTDFAKNWATISTFRFVSDGSLQAGAGEFLYMGGFPGFSPYRGQLNNLVNTWFGAADSWRERGVMPDTFVVDDPVMAPSFVIPPSNAVIWTMYTHNYLNSGDWDIQYICSTDAGLSWSGAQYLTGPTGADECYCDIKPYADAGNAWMNASYISEASYRTVFRHYCEQSNPLNWSDTLRINTHSAGTGQSIRPLLVYSPGAPGTGAGCVFVGAGLQNIYWNAPWTSSNVAEPPLRRPAPVFSARPNPTTGSAVFGWTGDARSLVVVDAAGRVVRAFDRPASGLVWDRRDGSGRTVAAGVYLARLITATGSQHVQLVVK